MAPSRRLSYSAAMPAAKADGPDLDALARRYVDLWEGQVVGWAGDAALADGLRAWLALIGLGRMPASWPAGTFYRPDESHNRGGDHARGHQAQAGTAPPATPSRPGQPDLAQL